MIWDFEICDNFSDCIWFWLENSFRDIRREAIQVFINLNHKELFVFLVNLFLICTFQKQKISSSQTRSNGKPKKKKDKKK